MIEQEYAIDIARKRASEKGWGFREPVEVVVQRAWFSDTVVRYEIEINAGNLGTKARFVIDAKTGEIISEGYIPR